uniref:CobW/HypB/UreG nucleotide-binding domain-containing protein n=2 Tax=Physcomitrium patens TaxID=3218 RepID=A0A2K1ISL7_PHYPA|nr:hypothetical protein PHYPA_026374 [Physcomitrium patens]
MGGVDASDSEWVTTELQDKWMGMSEDEADSLKSDDDAAVEDQNVVDDQAESNASLVEMDPVQAALSARIMYQEASLKKRARRIEEMRLKLQRYEPGQWLVESGGMRKSDFAIPEVTTLLVVGSMGAGKSTLINNLIRVLNNKSQDFDRAQVCGDPGENGTYFLNEYMLNESKNNICVFDSRGMPELKVADGLEVLEDWMVKGVRHGQMVIRTSDSSRVKEAVERKARQGHHKLSKKRHINFVIFVINATTVHKIRHSGDTLSRPNFLRIFKFPLITFKDDRPVVVMTHGDELSEDDRLAARIYLGNLLGVSPVDHVFDIAGFTGRVMEDGDQCAENDLLLLDMLEYALQRADRNLPYKPTLLGTVKLAGEMMASGFKELDSRRQMALVGLAVCWLILLALLLVTYAMF